MVNPEKFGHFHLVYHFAVPLRHSCDILNHQYIVNMYYVFITEKNYHTKKSYDQNYAQMQRELHLMIWAIVYSSSFFLKCGKRVQIGKLRPGFFARLATTIVSVNTKRKQVHLYPQVKYV